MGKCLICEKEKEILVYSVRNRGFGSRFDGYRFSLTICHSCGKQFGVKEEWFEQQNQPNQLHYLFEDEIDGVLEQIPQMIRQQVVGVSQFDEVADQLFN